MVLNAKNKENLVRGAEKEPLDTTSTLTDMGIDKTPEKETNDSQCNDQSITEKIKELALLTIDDYEKVRNNEAKMLDFRVGILDILVKKERGDPETEEGSGRAITPYEPEPWGAPVNGEDVLDQALKVIMRHMVFRKEDAIACVLWAVHAHMFDIFSHTPRLLITAPDSECGKTLLMYHMVGNLVTRPFPVEIMKAAPFFRMAEAIKPTFLIDEMDAFIKEDSDLLAAVNSGWEPHGGVPRCVGDNNEVRMFSTHCPVVMTGIELNKKLPQTTISRSVVISLERATYEDIPYDDIYDKDVHKTVLIDIGRKIARWVLGHREEVKEMAPSLPSNVRNRLADKWRPLFKIANVVGGKWPEYAEAALFGQVDMSELSTALILLGDIRKITKLNEGNIFTKDMISQLCEIKDSRWVGYNFKASNKEDRKITSRQIANLLKKYNVLSKNITIGEDRLKGYEFVELQKVWERYLKPVDSHDPHDLSVQEYDSHNHAGLKQSLAVREESSRTDETPLKPAYRNDPYACTDRKGGIRRDEGKESDVTEMEI